MIESKKNKHITWQNIDEIVYSLIEKYPEINKDEIYNLRFSELKSMITNLSNFEDDISCCNEKKLEAIQSKWNDEIED